MTKTSNLLFATFFTFSSLSAATNDQKTGVASYYGKGFYNRLTANGEHFRSDSLTAAHRTLPFGTLVQVTSLRTNKSVIVRINDRGPVSRRKIIDLSEGAATQLGMLQSGIAKVRLTVLNDVTGLVALRHATRVKKIAKHGKRAPKEEALTHKSNATASYIIQAGAFMDHENAVKAKESIDSMGVENSSINMVTVNKVQMYRLYISLFANMEEVEELLRRLRAENVKAFIFSMKN